MNKPLVLLLSLILQSSVLFSQKQGNNWCFADSTGIDFNYTPPLVTDSKALGIEANAAISDNDGGLLFYVASKSKFSPANQSLSLFNDNHLVVNGGDSLLGHESITQGALILPLMETEGQFHLFHLVLDFPGVHCSLFYSRIKCNQNSNSFSLCLKNIPFTIDDSLCEKMVAVRHANGRDWWVLLHGSDNNTFHKLLICNDSVQYWGSQNIGSIYDGWDPYYDVSGQMAFSPDGSMLASAFRYVDVFSFNRCTGDLSNWRCINGESQRHYGVAFSPSNRFLYVSHTSWINQFTSLFQYDLESSNVYGSQTTLLRILGDSTNIASVKNGPNGKIYVAITPNGNFQVDTINRYLGVVSLPDSLGLACDFDPQGMSLNGHQCRYGLPNIPDYSLGVLEGSECDTIPDPPPIQESENLCYIPNVFSPNGDGNNDYFLVRGEKIEQIELRVFNRWGNCVFSTEDISGGWDGKYNGQDCPEGVYFYTLMVTYLNGVLEERKGNITLLR